MIFCYPNLGAIKSQELLWFSLGLEMIPPLTKFEITLGDSLRYKLNKERPTPQKAVVPIHVHRYFVCQTNLIPKIFLTLTLSFFFFPKTEVTYSPHLNSKFCLLNTI